MEQRMEESNKIMEVRLQEMNNALQQMKMMHDITMIKMNTDLMDKQNSHREKMANISNRNLEIMNFKNNSMTKMENEHNETMSKIEKNMISDSISHTHLVLAEDNSRDNFTHQLNLNGYFNNTHYVVQNTVKGETAEVCSESGGFLGFGKSTNCHLETQKDTIKNEVFTRRPISIAQNFFGSASNSNITGGSIIQFRRRSTDSVQHLNSTEMDISLHDNKNNKSPEKSKSKIQILLDEPWNVKLKSRILSWFGIKPVTNSTYDGYKIPESDVKIFQPRPPVVRNTP
ncbi:unnamed protein product [Macrosiphum euphorbiae]|uniref:Uncharacterized protein n=1 Tax=Macrosiphum euphorbiae TaxID=13131 RepID=A0AAV0XHY4_9HEMI|nr:unnamed protein product [Macrosiphum euphorbiae]